MKNRRVDIKEILATPHKRRELMVGAIIAIQAREGITTTREQAEAAYAKIQQENFRYSRKERQPGKPLKVPGGYRPIAENYADCELFEPRIRKILNRRGVTKHERETLMKMVAEAWLTGWVHANVERDDEADLRDPAYWEGK